MQIPEGFATALLFVAVGGPFVCFFIAVVYDYAMWRTGHRAEAAQKQKRRKRRVTLTKRARQKSRAIVRLSSQHLHESAPELDETAKLIDDSDAVIATLDQPEAKEGKPDGQGAPPTSGPDQVGNGNGAGGLDAPETKETKKHDKAVVVSRGGP